MLKIRLQRVGRRHEPSFRVIVTESTRGPKSGDFIEILGNHNPKQKDITHLKADRIKYWISKGAQVSGTVHNLLITHGVIKGEKINVLPKKTPQVSEQPEEKKEEKKVEEKNEDKEDKKESEKEEVKKETEEKEEKVVSKDKDKEEKEEKSDKKEETDLSEEKTKSEEVKEELEKQK